MNNWKSYIVILIFQIGPISESNGQYQKLFKGQPFPYDTGVAVRIDRYRLESQKFKAADMVIDSLNREIKGLYTEIGTGDSITRVCESENQLLMKSFLRKDSTNSVLEKSIIDIVKLATDKKMWYEKIFDNPFFWGTLGFIGGILIAK